MESIATRSGRLAIASALVLATALTGCGDDSSADTIPVSEWVAEFDRLCVETGAELSDPALTDEEFTEISDRAIAEMRTIGPPDEMADEAEALLEALETTNNDQTLSDEEITSQDQQFLAAATILGISQACLRGAEG